jgi:hypothetical protein
VFSALQEILVDRIEDEKAYGSPYLSSSRLREISPPIIRKLANAGAMSPIPDSRKYLGEEFNEAFMRYIEIATNELSAAPG